MLLPLFPLALFLLPGGRSKLRIFEPRYLRLVTIACENQKGFVLCQPQQHKSESFKVGVHCLIEDFEQLEDGLLGISIKALERVEIADVSQADDQLFSGLITIQPEWLNHRDMTYNQEISRKLAQVLKQHPLYKLHPNYLAYDDPQWVILRWLELLPFSSTAKNRILEENDFSVLCDLVHNLLSDISIDVI